MFRVASVRDKVYINLIALSKEAKHNTPFVMNLLLRYN